MKLLPGKRAVMVFFAVAAVMLLPLAVQADLNFDLSLTNDANIGSGPYVNVNVHLVDSTHATVTANAYAPYLMGNGQSFALNVAGAFSSSFVSVTPLVTDPFTTSSGPPPLDGWGNFNLEYNLPNFSPGNRFDILVLNLVATGTNSWANDAAVLTPNAKGHLAAAHIGGTTALTAKVSDNPVPIPPSALLFGSGLLGLGLVGWRRREKKA